MSAADISVIIPAYNREMILGKTLESLLRQTVPAREIIVVDDGSQDGTAGVAESFGSPVRVIRQANAGPGAARNRGFRESKGAFIHFFDSDDIAVCNKHEVQLRALQDSGADIAFGPWVKGVFAGDRFEPENHVYQQKGLPPRDLTRELLTRWSVVPHACLFRRRIIEKGGSFPTDLHGTEDQLMFLRCLLSGAKVVHSPGTLELYRTENNDKITASPEGHRKRIIEWARFLLMADQECRQCGVHPCQWFGFRLRAWVTHRDLNELQGGAPEEVLSGVERLFGRGGTSHYRLADYLFKKSSSVKSRLVGRRGCPAFRMGRITGIQASLIRQAGYNLKEVT